MVKGGAKKVHRADNKQPITASHQWKNKSNNKKKIIDGRQATTAAGTNKTRIEKQH